MSGSDWEDRAGRVCLVLGWSPEAFWNATPAEVAAVVRALTGDRPAPADGALVRRMQEAFPDG